MSGFAIGKYKNILVSIGLFLILDASVLILNFYISFQIAEDAASINLSGRQRMLSQRMTKSLLDLDYSFEDTSQRNDIIKELTFSRNLFDETFTAFDLGGAATGAGGNKILLNRAEDENSRRAVESAKSIWTAYKDKIDQVIDTPNNNESIKSAIAFGQQNNLLLLKLMNDLTVSLEAVAASKAERLRLIQTAGIGMALINFFIILFHFVGQLRKGDEVLEKARKETSEILLTVNEGLFLIHEDFTIGSQRSDKLYEILNISDEQDVNFESLLKDIVSVHNLEAAQGFLRLLFNPKIKENLIGDLNPLEKIQVNIADGSGGFSTKYLSFDFKRVYHNTEIVDVLATVNDITLTVKLEKELSQAKEHNEQQIGMLTGILHANPSLLKIFLDSAYQCFSNINRLLKQPTKTQLQFHDKVNAIFIEIHNLKGESSALSLTEFVALCHNFEEELDSIRQLQTIKGQDFLSLAVRLDNIINYAQSVTTLVEKLSQFGRFSPSEETVEHEYVNHWETLSRLTKELSEKYDKNVMLATSGLNDTSIPNELRETINSICIQLIRNSIVHGIESPEEREAAQKSLQGRIDIRLSSTSEGMIEMVFKDDGAGFDFNKLRQRALASGQWTEQEIELWDNKRLLSLIFTPGFSTADTVNDDAGRGVGMDVVMQKVKQVKGKINISHRESQYSRFTISFPLMAMNKVA